MVEELHQSIGDSQKLLVQKLGSERISAEPEAASELVELCAGLPLALGIVAARAAVHPWLRLSTLAQELRGHTSRLDGLGIGDARVDLRAVFSWSLRALRPEAVELFGALGLVPGPEIGRSAVAALGGIPATQAAQLLHELEDAHLLTQSTPDRYQMHDLVRLHAKENSTGTESLRRWVDFHTHSANAVERALFPRRVQIELEPPVVGCIPDVFADVDAAMAWMDVEHENVVAAQAVAEEALWHNRVWQIARSVDTYYWRRGYLRQRITMWLAGLRSAEALGQLEPRLLTLRELADAYARAGEHDNALKHVEEALLLAEQSGNDAVRGHIHYSLVSAWDQRGDSARGLVHAEAALLAYQGLGNPVWLAQGHIAVGWCLITLGQHEQARSHCENALALYREHGDRSGEAGALEGLGMLARNAGRHSEALAYFLRAQELCLALGNLYTEAEILAHIGEAYAVLGRHQEARRAWRRAAESFTAQHRDDAAQRALQQVSALGDAAHRRRPARGPSRTF